MVATVLQNYETARANYAAQLAEISANPRPSYSVGGRSFDWVGYQRFLLEMIAKMDEHIALLDDTGTEVWTEGYSG